MGSLTSRYFPSSCLSSMSTSARTMPQQWSMFRLICPANSLGLQTCAHACLGERLRREHAPLAHAGCPGSAPSHESPRGSYN